MVHVLGLVVGRRRGSLGVVLVEVARIFQEDGDGGHGAAARRRDLAGLICWIYVQEAIYLNMYISDSLIIDLYSPY